jgi:hypothetical protein
MHYYANRWAGAGVMGGAFVVKKNSIARSLAVDSLSDSIME